jgi:predicted GIY-YIG superfamily endonuclease
MLKCSCCKENKPFTSFHKNISTKSGYANYCKVCKKANRTKKVSIRKKRRKIFNEVDKLLVVYEIYDNQQNCIYIGQSCNFIKRWFQHKKNKNIAENTNLITISSFLSYPDMVFYEAQQIIQKQPKYNKRIKYSVLSINQILPDKTFKYDKTGKLIKD